MIHSLVNFNYFNLKRTFELSYYLYFYLSLLCYDISMCIVNHTLLMSGIIIKWREHLSKLEERDRPKHVHLFNLLGYFCQEYPNDKTVTFSI